MTAIWMTFNFLLLILAFYLILQLYQRVRLLQSDAKQENGDLEKLLAVYLEDIRKENDRVIQALTESMEGKRISRRRTATQNKQPQVPETSEKTTPDAERNSHAVSFRQILQEETGHQTQVKEEAEGRPSAGKDTATAEWMPPIEGISDQLEESLPIRAMKLKEKGYATTRIAKELKMGKEEIELLLKFQGKKNL
jgi:hypothetical protein